MSKISKGKAGEKKVATLLDSIPESHYSLNDVTLINATSEMSHQIDHILIHPHGLFVIETKNYSGKILVDENGSWLKVIRGNSTKISNPLRQNRAHAITLRKALKSKYKPIPVTVFVQNNAPYLPDENLINIDDLLLFVDSYPYERRYGQKELDEMRRMIEALAADVTLKEHRENIRVLKQVKKEVEAEMTLAIEQGICPRCNGKLVINGFDYRCPKCGYHFKL